MGRKTFKDEMRYLRKAMLDPDFYETACLNFPDIAKMMKEFANLMDFALVDRGYSERDYAGDILTIMEFLASDEAEKYSEGSELQLSMLQAALLNYADSLKCFDVAQDD